MVPPPTASPRERRSEMRRSTAPAGLTSSHHKMPSRQGRGAACMKPRSRSASWRMSTSSVQVQAATSARPATSCCWQEAKKLQAHAWRGKLRRTSYIYVFASPTQDPSVLRTRIFPQNHFASDLLPRHFINSVHLADSTSTTHLYYDYYDAVRDQRGRTTQAGAADVPATLHRLMDRRGHG